MKASEQIKYVVNSSFISHRINSIVFPRGRFVAVSDSQLKELEKVAMFQSLINTKDFEVRNEIDESMRTTEEKLKLAKDETEEIKAQATEALAHKDAELAEKDKQIAELTEKLEAIAKGK